MTRMILATLSREQPLSITLQELGDLVAKTRAERQLSQDSLASKIGPPVNRSMVAHFEQGLRVPPPESLARILIMQKGLFA